MGKVKKEKVHTANRGETKMAVKREIEAMGVKPPYNLNREKMLLYRDAIHECRARDIPVEPAAPMTSGDMALTPQYNHYEGDFTRHLAEFGWVTVAVPDMNPAEYADAFFTTLERQSPRFRRDDPSTYKHRVNNFHGIFKQYFGHTAWQWSLREKCLPIFQEIYNDTDLLCSYDGACFYPSMTREKYEKTKSWLHLDQGRFYTTDFECVQGAVNISAAGPNDGGTVMIEGSHHVFKEYMEKHPTLGFSWGRCDMSDPLVKDLPRIKVCAPAGHVTLWDSRLIHANCPPLAGEGGVPRMVAYVSMQPASRVPEEIRAKRVRLYQQGRMTSHWCYGDYFSETAEHPQTYGREDAIRLDPSQVEIAPLNAVQTRLVSGNDEPIVPAPREPKPRKGAGAGAAAAGGKAQKTIEDAFTMTRKIKLDLAD